MHTARFYQTCPDRRVICTLCPHHCHISDGGRSAGLRYVYQGNSPAPSGERTYCYRCQTLLIDRQGFTVRSNRLHAGCCPCCGTPVDGFFK